MIEKEANKIIKAVLLLMLLSSLAIPHSTWAYNKSWDQGHKKCVSEDGKTNWGKFDDSGVFHGGYNSKECCELLCKVCPVYAKTGRYQRTFTDLSVPGVGPSLSITRTYNSQEWSSSLLGYSWTFNFGRKLIITRNSAGEKVIGVLLRTGEKNYYQEDLDGTLTRLTDYGANYDLIKNTDNTYAINNKDGSRYELREDGKISKIIDKNQNEMLFTYNSVGCLSRITNASGNYFTFQLGANGKIASVSDNLGRTVSYGYDDNGNLTSTTDPLGNTSQYVYNSNNFLIQIVDARGNSIESVTYDNHQPPRVSSLVEKGETYTISYFDGATEKTDSNGNKWTYYFNDVGVIERVVDPLGNVKQQRLNKITSTSVDWEEDLNGNRTTYTYDSGGNVSSKTDPLGNTWTYTYISGTDLMQTTTNPIGIVTRYQHDGKGNRIAVIRDYGGPLENTIVYTYDNFGNQTSIKDPLGNMTTFEYDTNGKLIRKTDPSGNVHTYTYDPRGNRLSHTDGLGITMTYVYDLVGRLMSVTDALGNTTNYGYDANGNMISMEDANGYSMAFNYDAYNRLIQQTNSIGKNITYLYNHFDKITSSTDGNGNTTHYGYDMLERLTSVTNANNQQISYSYDNQGNLIRRVDPRGGVTAYAYNANNRVVDIVYPDGSSEGFSYNPIGMLVSETDRNGNVFYYEYDSLNRRVTKLYPDGTSLLYSYDLNNNVIAAANDYMSYNYEYDQLGRTVSVKNNLINKTISYTYLPNNMLSTMVDAEGDSTHYTYDQRGLLTAIRDFSGGITSYQYDNGGRRLFKTLPNNVIHSYNHDAAGRLTAVECNHNSNLISRFEYGYDSSINKISKTTLQGVSTYLYDNIYQLHQATSPISSPETYTYDTNGNRLTSSDYANWTYDITNKLLSYGEMTFTYDSNGNMLNKSEPYGTTSYQWDYDNRLIRINFPSGDTAQYEYDTEGRRASKSFGGISSYFLYDLKGNIIAEYSAGGELLAKYVYGPTADEPILQSRAETSYYYLLDGSGSVVELTDSSGGVVQTYRYDAFGNVIEKNGSITNPFMYTGREFDNESGLYYYRARYYDSSLGRFLSLDPLRYNTEHNFYLYVHNNPVSFTDPYGLKACVLDAANNDPNAATIVCDGAGNITTQLGWCGKKGDCFKNCCLEHEATHKSDCQKVSPNVCKGAVAGTRVSVDSVSFAHETECNAYTAEVKCEKAALNTKECCGDKELEKEMKFAESQVKNFCP